MIEAIVLVLWKICITGLIVYGLARLFDESGIIKQKWVEVAGITGFTTFLCCAVSATLLVIWSL